MRLYANINVARRVARTLKRVDPSYNYRVVGANQAYAFDFNSVYRYVTIAKYTCAGTNGQRIGYA